MVQRLLPVVLALAVAAPVAAAAPTDDQLLERHRPLLRYDAAEDYFAQEADPGSVLRPGPELVYGHIARQDGEAWLQYWLYFTQNTQDRGIFKTGRHEGDWELVQVGLGDDDQADEVTFSQHSSAETCPATEDEIEILDHNGKAPVAYVANGSHALYPQAGIADRPFPDPNDEADGDGRFTRPDLGPPGGRWATYEGRWGSSRAGIVPGEQSSPYGPPFQESGAWDRPAEYAAAARPCGSDPPGRWWALPALAGVLAALAAAAILAVRRLRG